MEAGLLKRCGSMHITHSWSGLEARLYIGAALLDALSE